MLPSFKNIVYAVIGVHLFFILLSNFSLNWRTTPIKRQAITVSTVKLKPTKKETVAVQTPQKKKEPTPIAKKEEKKEPIPIAKKQEKKTLENNHKKTELLAKAQQSISKIDTNYATVSTDPQYIDEIAALLKTLLKLPEKGDVEIELLIEKTGRVSKLTILSTQSNLNRIYVEKAVPDISFPQFGKHFKGEKSHQFIITLSDIK